MGPPLLSGSLIMRGFVPKVRAPWGKKDEKKVVKTLWPISHTLLSSSEKRNKYNRIFFFAPDKTVFPPILLRENEKWSGYIKKVELNSAPLPESLPASVSFSFFEPTVSDPELANLAVLLRSRKVGFPKKKKKKKKNIQGRSLSHIRLSIEKSDF